MSMYEFTVPVYRQILAAQIVLLDKAAAYCAEKGVPEAALLDDRLIDDMRPLVFQWQQTVRHSAGAVARVLGQPAPKHDGATLAELKQVMTAGLALLDAVQSSDLAGKESAEIVIENARGVQKYLASDYIASFSMPNFMFHATTAYDILRKNGVAVGKVDFLGKVKRI
jgi:hypothetical protein